MLVGIELQSRDRESRAETRPPFLIANPIEKEDESKPESKETIGKGMQPMDIARKKRIDRGDERNRGRPRGIPRGCKTSRIEALGRRRRTRHESLTEDSTRLRSAPRVEPLYCVRWDPVGGGPALVGSDEGISTVDTRHPSALGSTPHRPIVRTVSHQQPP